MPRFDKLTCEKSRIKFGSSVTVPAMPWERDGIEMKTDLWPCEPITYRKKKKKPVYRRRK